VQKNCHVVLVSAVSSTASSVIRVSSLGDF